MKNILIKGTIASGKTFHAKEEALKATGLSDFSEAAKNGRIVYVPMYEGYGYSDLINGAELFTKNNKMALRLVDKQFADICKRALNDCQNEYAIILDDIDRTDIAAVLGEIIYAIENRGAAVSMQNGEKMTVPENLTVIAAAMVPSINKLDLAFLRRFDHKEYFSDRGVLEKLVDDGECDKKALEEYDFFNSVIDQYLAYDLREQEKYYLLGHGWFIGKSEALVYQAMRYKVIPLIEEYAKESILDMSFEELNSLTVTAETRYNNSHSFSCTIEKVDSSNNVINESFDDVEKFLCKLIAQVSILIAQGKDRGLQQKVYRGIFELTWKSSLIDNYILINKLYLNTNCFKFRCGKSIRDGALLIEKEYRNNYPSSTQGGTVSLYPGDPVYRFLGKDHCIVNVRTGGSFSIKRSVSRISQANSTGYITINELLGTFIINYYDLYQHGIKQLLSYNTANENLQNILKIIDDDVEELNNIIDEKDIDEKDFYTVAKVLLDETKITVLNHKVNDTVTKIINGKPVTATLEGVYKMADNNYKDIMESMKIHQMILQGPPGTSKTYGARQFLKEQLGLPKGTDETVIENKLKECQLTDELYSKLKDGTITFDKKFYWDIVQFHPSYGYEDFVRGITVQPVEASLDKLTGEIEPTVAGKQTIKIEAPSMGIKYETVDKILGKTAKFALKAKEFNNKPVYLIIDEINRANVSSVFGELIYALEYRNEKIATPYSVDGVNEIELPDNLYLIGTMNTADRSIGNIDYAVRRRFIFFPMLPDREVINNSDNKDKELALFLFDKTAQLFDDHLNEDYNKDDVQVGHTMFLANDENETKLKFIYQVLPILREYYKDGILAAGKDNIIIEYLSKFGKKDAVTDDDLWKELLNEYSNQNNQKNAPV